ncbi:MAG: replication endonuclease, partial [Campylobacterota bacterium]|nr:replication endonuclease [Campylobacterota bacterium]
MSYGITQDQLEFVQDKIEKQANFLDKNSYLFPTTGEFKTLRDLSYSPNHSERYYARLQNRVNTFVTINELNGYVPLFLNVTLDGFFRRFMHGDFSEWTPELRDQYKHHIPNNKQRGFILDKIDNHETLTPKDVYKIGNYQFYNWYRSGTYQRIKKEGHKLHFIKATEPHKDGTPHWHLLYFVPKHELENLKKEFDKFFPAPRNKVKLTRRNTKKSKYPRDALPIGKTEWETQGFQIKVHNPISYIMKYINKSLQDLRANKAIDKLQAWYIFHKIPR